MFSSLLLLLALALLPSISAIPTISAVGSKFFNSNGDQWFIKGIAYQLTPDDPLVDTAQCTRDATLMQTLGTNAIRVYHVDASQNHDGCMAAFAAIGVYVFVDMDTFNDYILGDAPQWNQTQFDKYSAVMDTFAKYDNTAGLFVGNEIITNNTQGAAAAYIKAAARDLKAYRDSKKYRQIPVGYSAADIAELRPALQNYLVCGGNATEAVDFFSLNSYEWCGNVDYMTSGYANLQAISAGYPVPIFFSETGCNVPAPRTFADQGAIFGPNMVNTWSGSIIYEWIQEENKYGLIAYGNPSASFARSGTPTPITPDFSNLKTAWQVQPTGVKFSAYSASAAKMSTPACPSATPGGWPINGNPKIPAIGQKFDVSGTSQPSATVGNSIASISASATGTATSKTSDASLTNDKKLIAIITISVITLLVNVLY